MFKVNIKEIHVFDIDGCIFPSKNNEGNNIMPNNFIEESPKIIIKRMDKINLYPEFVKFYKLITNSIKNIKIYFITGRKKKGYQIITLEQLSILNTKKERDTLIFFPDETHFTPNSYYEFKIYHILKIITEDNGFSNIKIYDDRFEYFNMLEKKLKEIEMNNIQFFKVKDPKFFWKIKKEEYKNLVRITQNYQRKYKNFKKYVN